MQHWRRPATDGAEFWIKGDLFLFNHFINMRTTVSLSISCRKNVFLLKFSNKTTFFPHEMDKLTVVLMSIKRLNKERRPLVVSNQLFSVVLAVYKWFKISAPGVGRRHMWQLDSQQWIISSISWGLQLNSMEYTNANLLHKLFHSIVLLVSEEI